MTTCWRGHFIVADFFMNRSFHQPLFSKVLLLVSTAKRLCSTFRSKRSSYIETTVSMFWCNHWFKATCTSKQTLFKPSVLYLIRQKSTGPYPTPQSYCPDACSIPSHMYFHAQHIYKTNHDHIYILIACSIIIVRVPTFPVKSVYNSASRIFRNSEANPTSCRTRQLNLISIVARIFVAPNTIKSMILVATEIDNTVYPWRMGHSKSLAKLESNRSIYRGNITRNFILRPDSL